MESSAYYYRTKAGANNYKSYYVNGGGVYFEGQIISASTSDESLNRYTGNCKWYYKNSKPKYIRNFDEAGLEDGMSIYYYESGKIWKEVVYKKGKSDIQYKEYNEDGQVSQIFEEEFHNNRNDWDLYSSDKSISKIENEKLVLTSLTNDGTSRYISVPSQSNFYTIETILNTAELKSGCKTGLLFGFKDWNNYNFFLITESSFYIGMVFEGVSNTIVEGMFSSAIKKGSENLLKVISGEQTIFSINGKIQYSTTTSFRCYGSNIGFVVSGKSSVNFNNVIYKEVNFNSSDIEMSKSDLDVKGTGSGLIISTTGYVLTNYHVIDDAKTISVEILENGAVKTYSAEIVQKDANNDLAILKITDKNFAPLPSPLKYAFKETGGIEVGASVFTIGYPYALGGMGKEAKYNDGKISAKTGYNNAINAFQTSIPVQPGNSGGPVFNDKGQLIGVINAKIHDADNVSYAIKLNYIKTLVELLPETIALPTYTASNLNTEQLIKNITPYSVLIKIK
ncbi:MAG: trypsin-like peptidase domain-containing protein [Bacteroidetes bacterium]|nr:trypsin-like peptidase domain-containing protein [Bacteroidota bacterium]